MASIHELNQDPLQDQGSLQDPQTISTEGQLSETTALFRQWVEIQQKLDGKLISLLDRAQEWQSEHIPSPTPEDERGLLRKHLKQVFDWELSYGYLYRPENGEEQTLLVHRNHKDSSGKMELRLWRGDFSNRAISDWSSRSRGFIWYMFDQNNTCIVSYLDGTDNTYGYRGGQLHKALSSHEPTFHTDPLEEGRRVLDMLFKAQPAFYSYEGHERRIGPLSDLPQSYLPK